MSPTHIPEGDYYTKKKFSAIKGVELRTVQQWIDKGWINSIHLDGMGHIIEEKWLDFEPPKPGPSKQRAV